MNTINFISICTMKPSSRILIGCKNSSFLARCQHTLPMSNNPSGLNLDHNNIHYPFRMLGFARIMNGSHKAFGLPSSSFGESRVTPRPLCSSATRTSGDVSTIAEVDFKARNMSSSIETRVSDNNLEKVYVNARPLVIETTDEDEKKVSGEEESRLGVGEEDARSENARGLNKVSEGVASSKNSGEETEVEKEAWKLLQEALVTYCDTPVGTVAANDSSDEQPLNYDQVFIRDFIPSALAFLLKGENEIVKNFLLHTLQLQVSNIHALLVSRNNSLSSRFSSLNTALYLACFKIFLSWCMV